MPPKFFLIISKNSFGKGRQTKNTVSFDPTNVVGLDLKCQVVPFKVLQSKVVGRFTNGIIGTDVYEFLRADLFVKVFGLALAFFIDVFVNELVLVGV